MSLSGVRPFLRWAGSKRQLLPILSTYWSDNFERYVEPFAGSACFFFYVGPSKALLGDLNSELIGTLREIKNNSEEVIRRLRTFKKGRKHYFASREIDPASLDPAQRAARFIYLNRFCFNGLYRTNNTGGFNVPYGGEKSGNLPTVDHLLQCSEALKRAQLVAGDFEKALKKVKLGDFVYMDPPFSVNARRVFNEYDKSVFNFEDVLRLRHWTETLANQNIPFLVSYAESDEAEILKDGFDTKVVTVKRSIAGFSGSRTYSNELLISYGCGKKYTNKVA